MDCTIIENDAFVAAILCTKSKALPSWLGLLFMLSESFNIIFLLFNINPCWLSGILFSDNNGVIGWLLVPNNWKVEEWFCG